MAADKQNKHFENVKKYYNAIETGKLITYSDLDNWDDIFLKKDYIDKWLKLVKWDDGYWKYALIIGDYARNKNAKIVELVDDDNRGIYTINKRKIYEYKSGFKGKKWK